MMIHTDRAIVVEGKYDKIKLGGIIDGTIICTGGFRIYKDKEMQSMLRTLAKKQGLAVLTDSDMAGFKIRGFLRNICGKENIVDVYIPDLYGKEKRKDHPSKEGKLGVEGVSEEVIIKALREAGIGADEVAAKVKVDPITKMDLFELGLSGGEDSAINRKKLCRLMHIPEHLTANSLVTVLDALLTKEELVKVCSELYR